VRYLIGSISAGAAAAWASVVIALLIALVGAVWRLGSKMQNLTDTVNDHGTRIKSLETDRDIFHPRRSQWTPKQRQTVTGHS
jgi:uncharacterized membrane protein YqjE